MVEIFKKSSVKGLLFNGEDINQNIYNYDNPLAEKTIKGVNFRIGEGLKINKKKYILYKDGVEFNSSNNLSILKKLAIV